MNITKLAISPAAAVTNGVCLSQTPGGAGNLTLNGSLVTAGVAIFDIPRRVAIVSTSDISNRTFIITGTDRNGYALSETITGPNNATVYTLGDFATVTVIHISGAAAGALTVGTNGVASTAWYAGDWRNGKYLELSVELAAGSSMTYTVEVTTTDLNDVYHNLTPAQQVAQAQTATVFPSPDTGVVSANTNKLSNFTNAYPGQRLTVNGTGTATITFVPASSKTY